MVSSNTFENSRRQVLILEPPTVEEQVTEHKEDKEQMGIQHYTTKQAHIRVEGEVTFLALGLFHKLHNHTIISFQGKNLTTGVITGDQHDSAHKTLMTT